MHTRGLLAGSRMQSDPHRQAASGNVTIDHVAYWRFQHLHLPREMEMLEAPIRDVINRYIARGRLTVRVGLHAGASKQSARMHLNVRLPKAYGPELNPLSKPLT